MSENELMEKGKVEIFRSPRTGNYHYLHKLKNGLWAVKDYSGSILIIDTKDYFIRNFIFIITISL